MRDRKICFRCDARIDAELERRAIGETKTDVLLSSLERYFFLLARARKGIKEAALFSPQELGLLVDVCNGIRFEAWSLPLLAANVEDGIALDGLDRKWQVDGPALLRKLSALTPTDSGALIDAIERHWRRVTRGEQPPIETLLDD